MSTLLGLPTTTMAQAFRTRAAVAGGAAAGQRGHAAGRQGEASFGSVLQSVLGGPDRTAEKGTGTAKAAQAGERDVPATIVAATSVAADSVAAANPAGPPTTFPSPGTTLAGSALAGSALAGTAVAGSEAHKPAIDSATTDADGAVGATAVPVLGVSPTAAHTDGLAPATGTSLTQTAAAVPGPTVSAATDQAAVLGTADVPAISAAVPWPAPAAATTPATATATATATAAALAAASGAIAPSGRPIPKLGQAVPPSEAPSSGTQPSDTQSSDTQSSDAMTSNAVTSSTTAAQLDSGVPAAAGTPVPPVLADAQNPAAAPATIAPLPIAASAATAPITAAAPAAAAATDRSGALLRAASVAAGAITPAAAPSASASAAAAPAPAAAAPAPTATSAIAHPLAAAAPLAGTTPAPSSAVAQPSAAPLAGQISGPLAELATARPGEHVMTVRVAPDSLGPVTVRAHISSDHVRIELYAPNDAGRDALRAALPELKRDLAASGMNASLDLASGNQPEARDAQDRGGPVPFRQNARGNGHSPAAGPEPGFVARRSRAGSTLDVIT